MGRGLEGVRRGRVGRRDCVGFACDVTQVLCCESRVEFSPPIGKFSFSEGAAAGAFQSLETPASTTELLSPLCC